MKRGIREGNSFIFFIARKKRAKRFVYRVCCLHTRFATSNLANSNLYAYWGLVHNPSVEKTLPADLTFNLPRIFQKPTRERQGDCAITINTQDQNYN